MLLALSRAGALGISGGGLVIILAGLAMIFDWFRIGTAFASYYAFLSLLYGKRMFLREMQRRPMLRRFFGSVTLLIGIVWFVGGLIRALS
jgi:hypothetical protein